jgi:hypothetical protein
MARIAGTLSFQEGYYLGCVDGKLGLAVNLLFIVELFT